MPDTDEVLQELKVDIREVYTRLTTVSSDLAVNTALRKEHEERMRILEKILTQTQELVGDQEGRLIAVEKTQSSLTRLGWIVITAFAGVATMTFWKLIPALHQLAEK